MWNLTASVSMVLVWDEVEESFESIIPLESHLGASRAVTGGQGGQVPLLSPDRSCPTWSKTGRNQGNRHENLSQQPAHSYETGGFAYQVSQQMAFSIKRKKREAKWKCVYIYIYMSVSHIRIQPSRFLIQKP